jgi:hypothetical protein
MKAITKASRVNTALQVIQHMNNGMSVVDACKEVRLPRSSFYYIVQSNPDAIAEIQTLIDANQREKLILILQSNAEMLKKVIEDGLSDDTKPRDRVEIFLKLNNMIQDMMQKQQIESEIEREAQEFLKLGPQLVSGKSRLSATQTTLTIEAET